MGLKTPLHTDTMMHVRHLQTANLQCIRSEAMQSPRSSPVNPDLDIDSFVMPGSSNADENMLNSGVDLQFCVMETCENKEAAYEVLSFLLEDENVELYLESQNAVPCKTGDFELAPMLDGMKQFIGEERMADFQDHYYPSEMSVDAQIQTLLIHQDVVLS